MEKSDSAFRSIGNSLTRVLGLPGMSDSPAEFVLGGILPCELHGRNGRVYLAAILSEDEDIASDSSVLACLLEKIQPGQFPRCIPAYEEERKRVLVWQEMTPEPGLSDEALDVLVRNALWDLEQYSAATQECFFAERPMLALR